MSAVEVVDRDGSGNSSMRRVGQELGVDPMACYRHLPNQDMLLDAVVPKVVAEVVPPKAGDPLDTLARTGSRLHELGSRFVEVGYGRGQLTRGDARPRSGLARLKY